MKKSIKNRWVKALRSGKFEQGKGQLYNPASDEYCCLGVLCELAVKSSVIEEFDGWDGTLPVEVQEWAGLDSGDPTAGPRGAHLSTHNDGGFVIKPKEFPQIASLIERHL